MFFVCSCSGLQTECAHMSSRGGIWGRGAEEGMEAGECKREVEEEAEEEEGEALEGGEEEEE